MGPVDIALPSVPCGYTLLVGVVERRGGRVQVVAGEVLRVKIEVLPKETPAPQSGAGVSGTVARQAERRLTKPDCRS